MSFSKLPAAATYTAAMMESSTKMALAAIDGADVEVAEQQLPPSRIINGVRPQPSNRCWCGAQTYERPTRKWMSTFPEKETLARGYDDLAALRAAANAASPTTTTGIVSRTREALYMRLTCVPADELSVTVETTLQMQTSSDEVRPSVWQAARAQPATTWVREHLFQTALTPSDVGKLNHLVVPKHHAEKHLFLNRNPMMAAGIGMLIDFVDGSGKTWRFRYPVQRDQPDMHIDYWKTQKKPEDAMADAIAVDCHGVMLFGVDIATA
ncbi:putative AP2/ERF and B3 domain-containing protein Os01g0140700 [Miscanthus floridulus]|uniref:putative AP2/ERF and B3 domain-containing protein Os01g0140700 n=1 Tax=Miscanthus floridulus TaxID=154761 RepID=UPI00345A132A